MKKIIFTIIFLIALSCRLHSQELIDSFAQSFIEALLNNSEELNYFCGSTEVYLSQRLGITYTDVKIKQLISIDIPEQVKNELLSKQLKYTYEIIPLEKNFSKFAISIPEKELNYVFIFKENKLISAPSYYAKDWKTYKSKYFIFYLSDSSLINQYSIKKLDSFVDNILELLKFSKDKIHKLEDEKIYYFLCKDESEIKKLTGYFTRGLYYLANDFIISTFNTHYHEIAHLLINYKLENL